MFTGIIEQVGKVVGPVVAGAGGTARLKVDLGAAAEGVRVGDSIAIDGACLTVTWIQPPAAEFEMSAETLQRTTLGALRPGGEVNLERALRLGDRLGGHFVLGHVDGTGTLISLSPAAGQFTAVVGAAPGVISQLIPKGSVALDGISLTVVEVASDRFSIAILPFTIEHTSLRRKAAGRPVNIEMDVIGKYVARLLGRAGAASAGPSAGGSLTERFLEEQGFK